MKLAQGVFETWSLSRLKHPRSHSIHSVPVGSVDYRRSRIDYGRHCEMDLSPENRIHRRPRQSLHVMGPKFSANRDSSSERKGALSSISSPGESPSNAITPFLVPASGRWMRPVALE